MQDYGLVSIITPNWNCAKYICETIRSVQAQTYQNWEMIIVDDCSTDNSEEVVKPFLELDKRIRFLKNVKNSGAAVSRNYALREAKGRWIAFLDSDDLWLPEKLEKQLKFMVENGYHFSYTGRDFINEASDPLGKYVTGPKHITKIGMYCFCWVGCLSVIYDAEKIGLIQIADIKKNNDYAMWLKVCQKADCYLLDQQLAGELLDHSALSVMLDETVVLFCSTFCQRLEPMGVVSHSQADSPLLHALGNGISHRTVKRRSIVDDITHLVVSFGRKILIHLLLVEDELSEILAWTL